MPRPKFRRLPTLNDKLRSRFFARVDRRGADECWPWTAACFTEGYGSFPAFGQKWAANRMAHFLATGNDPENSLVCHSCDNPPCCNPAHLSLGSRADNVHQAWERSRANSNAGEKHPRARLTVDDVARIRARYIDGKYPREELAKEYGVSRAHIGNIVHRRAWKHS